MSHPQDRRKPKASGDCVLKMLGGDEEDGNIVESLDLPGGTARRASSALLAEIEGVPQHGSSRARQNAYQTSYTYQEAGYKGTGGYGCYYSSASSPGGGYRPVYDYEDGFSRYYNFQDIGRKFLPTSGASVYIDMSHLETALPETTNAYDYTATLLAARRSVRDALLRANARLPEGLRIRVFNNNVDSAGASFGGHLNVLVTRRCFDRLFNRKFHLALSLISHLVTSLPYTGAGKVGSDNHQSHVDFQIAQRPDFCCCQLTGPETTHNRPQLNSRDEALCGDDDTTLARLHLINFDTTLMHTSNFLKAGVTALVLAMTEQEHTDPSLILDDPLGAVVAISHDPSLRHKVRLLSGADVTAVEHQQALCGQAHRFVAAGRAQGIVPYAEDILALWAETLEQLRRNDTAALVRKCDWVLKKTLLEQAIAEQGLTWQSPEIRYLDFLYHDLDPSDGLYYACERANLTNQIVSDAHIERFVHLPPVDTRAWLRAHLLARLPAESIVSVDWDELRVQFPQKGSKTCNSKRYLSLAMADPLAFTREQCLHVIDSSVSIEQAIEDLGGIETSYWGQPITKPQSPATDPSAAGDHIVPVRCNSKGHHGPTSFD